MVFTFNKSRGRQHVEDILRKNFQGTLITDGYSAYARFAEQMQGVTHAQCWVHSCRYFVDAEDVDKKAADCALYFIGRLYKIEEHITDNNLVDEKNATIV